MSYIYDLTDTWTASGTTYHAIKMNVTNTASAAASKLVTLQIGGTDKFTVDKDGDLYTAGDAEVNGLTARTHLALDSGAADGANLIWRSAGYSDWNADNIYGKWRLYYGTTERFTITADGKVGLGVSSASYRLGVVDTGVTVSGNIASFGDSNIQNGLSLFSDDSGLTWGFNALNARALTMRTNQTDRVRIEGDGRVTFGGGALQSAWMSIYSGAYDTAAWFESSDRFCIARFKDGTSSAAGGASIGCDGDALYISTGSVLAQRFRIDALGNVLVGQYTSDAPGYSGVVGAAINRAGYFSAYRDADVTLSLGRGNSGNITLYRYAGTTTVGSISITASATAYNTSSDYRLKNVDGPLLNSGAFIDALKPVRGSWKVDGSTFIGFLAHEVQEVVETDGVVTGDKDGEEMQSMTYSSSEMIAHMIAELQSLRARVAELEATA